MKFTKKIWSASIGQYLYNAQTGAVPNINYVDRPFAAYLYGALGLQLLDNHENSGRLTLQVGTIGPSALGEEAQKLIHLSNIISGGNGNIRRAKPAFIKTVWPGIQLPMKNGAPE